MRRGLFALGLLVAAACMPACAPTSGRVKVAPPPIPRASPQQIDTSGLKAVRNLLGQPKSAIPVPVAPGLRRVTCTTCVQAQDDNSRRLNIYFDVDTGIIQRVACG